MICFFIVNNSMKVLFVAAEAAPLVKVGGLGDVAGSLPVALKKLGVDVRLAIPWYKEIDVKKWGVVEKNGVGETRLGGSDVPVYLVAKEVFAKTGEHKAILSTKEEERWFARFSRELVNFLKASEWKPDVFHGNDWHMAEALEALEEMGDIGSLVTIHNLNYHSKILKRAILAADVINAVSPTYAKEILTKEYCASLCEELNSRKIDLYGILNGIDYSVWDPALDKLIGEQFSQSNWSKGKDSNKKKLQARLGLEKSGELLLSFVGRLDPNQKGVRILVNSIDRIVEMGVQVVVLGTGDKKVERALKEAEEKHPRLVSSKIMYDEKLAHEIYAGSDALVIPSRYEPCGLIQMICMKYGTLPIAHAVGGLIDTIRDEETGFLYQDYKSRGFVRAVRRAKRVYDEKKKEWKRMVTKAMREDFSWDQSASEYVKLYKKALRKME